MLFVVIILLLLSEYEHVVKIIDGELGTEQHDEKIKIIAILQPKIARNIDAKQLCENLIAKELISDVDKEEICAINGNFTASVYLLNLIWRKKIDWYEGFLDALIDTGSFHVAELIDDVYVQS